MAEREKRRKVTVRSLRKMKHSGEKIAVLTAYDAGFAELLDRAGIDVLLVGDTLGMVVQGQSTTLPVDIADMIYHTRCVSRVARHALVIADMPFISYASTAQALGNAARLVREGGAHMVKMEGGAIAVEAVAHIVAHGIPVCGHLGLQPQSVHKLGGYSVQGRQQAAAGKIRADAMALQEAGIDMLVLECLPQTLAREITSLVDVPVIGIGAGGGCDGQVLVLYDMLGITAGRTMTFVRNFMPGSESIEAAVREYVTAVKNGTFPGPEHSFD